MKYTKLSTLFLTILLISGCSGHGLQDWADESFNNKTTEEVNGKSEIGSGGKEETVDVKEAQDKDGKGETESQKIKETQTVETSEEPAPHKVPTPTTVETKGQTQPSPSQNPQLNAISPSGTATSEGGAMQKSLDAWTEEEWTPTVEQNETIKKMNKDKERPFTLQEYVDKAGIYMDNKPKSDKPSHIEEMEKLPVIGK